MGTIFLVAYLIGVILAPVAVIMSHKVRKVNYTLGDLLFSIFTCWMSWIVVLSFATDIYYNVILFKYDEEE